eukprot:g15023.t1
MSGPVVSTQSGREALRGVEVLAFDLIFEVLTSQQPQQLAELLTAPLERAAAKGERDLAQRLVRAGAGIGNALHEAIRVMHAGTRQGAARVVDSLLRAGADETMVDNEGLTAADMTWFIPAHADLADEVQRVRELLANAPADRVWRRRGYLVLCRAHPERLQQVQATSSDHHADTARGSRSCAKVARVGGVGGDSGVDESIGGDWTVVVSKVLLLQEEGIFRTIMGYL